MINAKDIREGNVLLYLTPEKGWMEITICWGQIKWCRDNPISFNDVHKPLPITPELLDRCGFKKECNDLILHINDDILKDNTLLAGEFQINIKGFHHLQNILWDLCQIELKL